MQYGQGVPPVKEGEELELTIEAVGEKGDGIARKDGFVLFVPGTKKGEAVKVRVTRVLPKVGFAEKIGEATAPPPQEGKPKPAPEPEFDPQEELDSEDFGESSDESEDDSDDDAEDDSDDEKDSDDSSEDDESDDSDEEKKE